MSLPGTVFAPPRAKPPVIDPDFGWSGLAMTFISSAGREWDMCDPLGGLVVGRGIRGVGMPPLTHFRDESPATYGSRYRGYSVDARPVFWPVRLFHDGSSVEFVDRWNEFWDDIAPGEEIIWRVRGPHGTRSLRILYEKGGEDAIDMDPTFFGWVPMGLEFVADQPLWEGETVFQEWEGAVGRNFIDPAGSPPLHISRRTSTSSAVITNPGDELTYPLWVIYGPTESVSITYAGQRLTIPFAIPAGKAVTIDADPEQQAVVDSDGVDRYSELSAWGFAPLQPGANQSFTISMVGTGLVRAAVTPLYKKAF